MPTCKVIGCRVPTTRWGTLCNAHKCRQRRHGHPEQPAITTTYLRQYTRIVREHVRRNAASPVWAQLDSLWSLLIDECICELREQRREGRPSVAHERQAKEQLE